jgi:hypothetical protein
MVVSLTARSVVVALGWFAKYTGWPALANENPVNRQKSRNRLAIEAAVEIIQ